MAQIIDLNERRSEYKLPTKAPIKSTAETGERPGFGTILLFNGVRYSRQDVEPTGSSKGRAGRGRKHN